MVPVEILLLLLLLLLTSDESGFVVESFAVVNNCPVGVDVHLYFVLDSWIDKPQRGRYDRLGHSVVGLGCVRVATVSAPRRLVVVVVVETLDKLHRLAVRVGDDPRLGVRVSHHEPSASQRTCRTRRYFYY